ncbi:MAG TPA: hypothetical protein DD716_06360 [Thiomicrospira sp.]|nr:hypothetical protein [Thiomicrospira sp.]
MLTQNMSIIKQKALASIALPLMLITPDSWAKSTSLKAVEIQAKPLNSSSQKQHLQSDNLAEQSAGETLGDYLKNQPNINSASYGPGVGRPVVRGMSGYRVKILQNDAEITDMSAMSQDHAVAVMPKASERIELLKGPASLLYGATSGGAIRVVDNLDNPFFEKGFSGKLETSLSNNSQSHNLGGNLQASSDTFSLDLSGFSSSSEDYYDGNHRLISDSDVRSEQGQIGLGWQYRETGLMQVSYTSLTKNYGIPNSTAEDTRIDMLNKVTSFSLIEEDLSDNIELLKLSFLHSDYQHHETEGFRKDGLFAKKSNQLSLHTDYLSQGWSGSILLGFQDEELKVCHEHGGCKDFTIAERTGIESNLGATLENYLNSTGLAYSHGHPMPDTNSQVWNAGWSSQRDIAPLGKGANAKLSFGAHLKHRKLVANPDNIQETWIVPTRVDSQYYQTDRDWAVSLSTGFEQNSASQQQHHWAVNLSYLERLPSADELYWNGFHHATDSYIFGNRNLNKERSINLDFDWAWQQARGELHLNLFYYMFTDYIYQQTRYDNNNQVEKDPFHLSPVWETKQQNANFYGGSIAYDWQVHSFNKTQLVLENQLDMLSAKLANGNNLPRTAPMSYLIGLKYEPANWAVKLSLKHVFEANQLAENEASTAGYNWLSLYADWKHKQSYGEWKLWLKGENLLNEYAQNHLSFLKESAPLKGREIQAGVALSF